MRIIKRVSEEYIQDPLTGLYYWLAPVYKRGTDQQLLDDMRTMVDRIAQLPKQGAQVLRPTAMIQRSAMSKISKTTQDTLSKNTYLMLFDYGAPEPKEIYDGTETREWVSEGNNIFLWSNDDKIYTWCNSDQLAHRFYRVPKEVAMKEPFEATIEDSAESTSLPMSIANLPNKYHITGNIGGMIVDLHVEAE